MPSNILLSLFMSSIGVGYFLYGKKQVNVYALICGLALMGLPYLLEGAVITVLVGGVFVVVPWVAHKYIG